MFFILEGTGTLRYADKYYPVKPGDVICCPPGPEAPHQLVNTSDKELKYLAVSTMEEPEVAEYPDTGKVGVMAGSPPGSGGDPSKRTVYLFNKKSSGGVDYYWEGES
ncbi:MAG: cupin domain-containing protein [Deltaproteobacteria bacterium]|nr:cupin domain-containing protein [Deltaproteobacteria bacterium]